MRKLKLIVIMFCFTGFTAQVQAKAVVRVKAIGSSPKGQYVAFEEYGFRNNRQLPFSKIRVMNVWKGKYMESQVHVIGLDDQDKLKKIREKAKKLAYKKLQKFNISM